VNHASFITCPPPAASSCLSSCLSARHLVCTPANPFWALCPSSCLYARHLVCTPADPFWALRHHARYHVYLPVILFARPPSCLPVILFARPPIHSARCVIMPVIVILFARPPLPVILFARPPIHSARCVIMPVIMFICPSSCLHARQSILPAASSCPLSCLSARHLVCTPVILFARHLVCTPANPFCPLRHHARHYVYMPADSFCPPSSLSLPTDSLFYHFGVPVVMFISPPFCLYAHFLLAHVMSSCVHTAHFILFCHLVYMPAVLFTRPRIAPHFLYPHSPLFCLHARRSAYTPADSLWLPLLSVLYTCPPFCLYARRVVLHVISFTHLPFHPICHLLYIPAVLFTRPRFHLGRPSLFCLHARRFLVPIILSIPTFSSTRLQFCLHVHHFRHLLYSHYFLNIPTSLFQHTRHKLVYAISNNTSTHPLLEVTYPPATHCMYLVFPNPLYHHI
jgi:hypothetical protein